MSLRNIPFDEIDQNHLQGLIDNSVSEGKTIEYKKILPTKTDDGKKEFLADVSSFANSSGGDLIFGIEEDKTNQSLKLEGLDLTGSNSDSEILALQNTILNGLAPRLIVEIKEIKLNNGRSVIIIRIPKSWASPHMVTFKGSSRFFYRDSNGKHQMSIDEIRQAFGLTASQADHIRDYRTERLSKIILGETPIPMPEGANVT